MRTFIFILLFSLNTWKVIAQIPFAPIDTNFVAQTVNIPASPIQSQVLFIGGVDSVQTLSGMAISKSWNDFIGFVPITPNVSDSGYIVVNHEVRVPDTKGGDGGGMTSFKARRLSNGTWQRIGNFKNVDFSSVGGTITNCGGINGFNGRIWTSEEYGSNSNQEVTLFQSTVDTNDVLVNTLSFNQNIKKYQNYHWAVEVDPINAVAIRKQYNFGRYGHEGGALMQDNKTLYLADDNTPGIFYKFVATTAGDFTAGQLYAYQQDISGIGGTWITIPNNLDTLINSGLNALAKHATMFVRLEWVAEHNGKVYITETGNDNPQGAFDYAVSLGGTRSKHIRDMDLADDANGTNNSFKDYFGRVLVFDPATNNLSVFLEGGTSSLYPSTVLSNPDGLTFLSVSGRDYMVIQEDLNGRSQGRMPTYAAGYNTVCETYVVQMTGTNPTLNDIRRFLVMPGGAEVTGARATPDGKTLFINSQHPATTNTYPYNNSLTLAIWGFDTFLISLFDEPKFTQDKKFQIYPNPAARMLFFNQTTDVSVYDIQGKRVRVERNINSMDISDLTSGTYLIQNIKGEVQKLVIE